MFKVDAELAAFSKKLSGYNPETAGLNPAKPANDGEYSEYGKKIEKAPINLKTATASINDPPLIYDFGWRQIKNEVGLGYPESYQQARPPILHKIGGRAC